MDEFATKKVSSKTALMYQRMLLCATTLQTAELHGANKKDHAETVRAHRLSLAYDVIC